MDGATITAPNLAIWDAEKGWVVENEGVPPDIEVEQTPADVIAGRDPPARARHSDCDGRAEEGPARKREAAGVPGQNVATRSRGICALMGAPANGSAGCGLRPLA